MLWGYAHHWALSIDAHFSLCAFFVEGEGSNLWSNRREDMLPSGISLDSEEPLSFCISFFLLNIQCALLAVMPYD